MFNIQYSPKQISYINYTYYVCHNFKLHRPKQNRGQKLPVT